LISGFELLFCHLYKNTSDRLLKDGKVIQQKSPRLMELFGKTENLIGF